MRKTVIRYALIALAMLLIWFVAFLLLRTAGRWLITGAYHNTLPFTQLNRIVEGAAKHSLDHYYAYADKVFMRVSKIGAVAAALTFALAFLISVARRAGKTKELALLGFTTVACFLASEALFRVLGVRGYHTPRTREWSHALLPRSDLIPGVRIQFKPYSSFLFRYDSNPRGYFDPSNGLTYSLNNFGFRDHEYRMDRDPSVTRIIVLGDSFVFGEGVRTEHMFTKLLEEQLSASGHTVEVLNFSVGGWGTRDEISYLDHMGVRFSPDIVLLAYVLNDADYAGGLDVWDAFRSQYERSLFRYSYLLSYAYAKLGQRFFLTEYVKEVTERSLEEKDAWTQSFAELDRGKRIAEAVGAKFCVAILPFMYELSDEYPFMPIHRMIQDHCIAAAIPVRDIFPAFKGTHYTDMWVHASDPHPNEKGHLIIAQELSAFAAEVLVWTQQSECKAVNRAADLRR